MAPPRINRRVRAVCIRPVALAALCGALGLAACSDPLGTQASFDTVTSTVTVNRLNGTTPELPAAVLLVSTPQAVRISSDYLLDFSVEFDGAGAARLVPVQRIGSPTVLTQSRVVGFQKLSSPFDEVLRAPSSGYDFTNDLAVSTGDVGVIESRTHPYCASIFYSIPTIYAKFVVEELDPSKGQARIRLLVDPNCGYRGLETGTPSR